MVVYEGPVEGLLAKVAELGGKRVRLEVVETARVSIDWEEHERNLRELEEMTKGKPPITRLFTAEDLYGEGDC